MSTRFCFIHAADLHLDSPFEGIGRTAPPVAATLREASLEAYDRLVQLCIDRDAAFLLLAGDIYDGPQRGLRAQLRFLAGIERLDEAGIHVFGVNGNHDAVSEWEAARRVPENLTIFGHAGIELHAVERDGDRVASVYGISYSEANITENLAVRFRRQESPGLHIGLLHCAAGSSEANGTYSACSVRDLLRAGMDYWALGHAHEHRILSDGNPWIVYPGTTQGRGTRGGEWWAKGAAAVEVEEDVIRKVEFVPLDAVRIAEARVDIESIPDVASLQKRILSEARNLREAQGRALVLRVTLQGRGAVHEDLQVTGRTTDLLADLRMLLADESPMIWIDQIVDESRGTIDRDAIAHRGDFASDLLRQSEDFRMNPERLGELLAHSLEPLRAARYRRWVDADEWDPLALLREAEQRALDMLETGGAQ